MYSPLSKKKEQKNNCKKKEVIYKETNYSFPTTCSVLTSRFLPPLPHHDTQRRCIEDGSFLSFLNITQVSSATHSKQHDLITIPVVPA